MKRGQMEVIGLVIIVILISLGLLFAARFTLQDKSGKEVFTRKGLAASVVSAALKTTMPATENCAPGVPGEARPKLGGDLLEDCAVYWDTRTTGQSYYQCGGKHSCQVAEEILQKLFAATLEEWGKKYQFKSELIEGDNTRRNLVELPRGGRECRGATDRDSSGLFPLQTESGLFIETILYVCD